MIKEGAPQLCFCPCYLGIPEIQMIAKEREIGSLMLNRTINGLKYKSRSSFKFGYPTNFQSTVLWE